MARLIANLRRISHEGCLKALPMCEMHPALWQCHVAGDMPLIHVGRINDSHSHCCSSGIVIIVGTG